MVKEMSEKKFRETLKRLKISDNTKPMKTFQKHKYKSCKQIDNYGRKLYGKIVALGIKYKPTDEDIGKLADLSIEHGTIKWLSKEKNCKYRGV